MAKIWFVKEGEEPTLGGFETEKTLRWCADNLGLVPQDWEAPPQQTTTLWGEYSSG